MKTTTVKERPILFSDQMVKAIREGRKTMTRRVMFPKNPPPVDEKLIYSDEEGLARVDREVMGVPVVTEVFNVWAPYRVGMHLWVREGVYQLGHERTGRNGQYLWPKFDDESKAARWFDSCCNYTTDLEWNDRLYDEPGGRLNKMFMPRWASRITLEVTGVKVERVNSISEEDAMAEGVEMGYWPHTIGQPPRAMGYRPMFIRVWNEIHGDGAWELNPFVWCISFKVVDPREGSR